MAKNEWFTFPASGDDGRTIIVTGRIDVEKYRSRERNNIRVEVTLPYTPMRRIRIPFRRRCRTPRKDNRCLRGSTQREEHRPAYGHIHRCRRTQLGVLHFQHRSFWIIPQPCPRSIPSVASQHLCRKRPRMGRIRRNEIHLCIGC